MAKKIHVPGNVHFRDFKAFCRRFCLYYPVKVVEPTTPIFTHLISTMTGKDLANSTLLTRLLDTYSLLFYSERLSRGHFSSTVKEVNRGIKFTSY